MSIEASRLIPAENLHSSSFLSNLIKQGAGRDGGTKYRFRGKGLEAYIRDTTTPQSSSPTHPTNPKETPWQNSSHNS